MLLLLLTPLLLLLLPTCCRCSQTLRPPHYTHALPAHAAAQQSWTHRWRLAALHTLPLHEACPLAVPE